MAKKKKKVARKPKVFKAAELIPTEGFLNAAEMVEVIHTHDTLQRTMTPAQRRVSELAQHAMDDTMGIAEVVADVERLPPGQYLVNKGHAYMHTHDRKVEDVTTYVNRLEKAAIVLAGKLRDSENLARERNCQIQRLEEALDSASRRFTTWQLFRQAFRKLFGQSRFA